jgi:signal transduction histidine kinase
MSRWLPRSLFGRLLAIALVATAAALLFAGVTIGHVLERFVMRGMDDRLDAQIAVLSQAIRPDGTLDPARAVPLPGFDDPGSGWVWQVDGQGRRWTSGTAPSIPVSPPPPAEGPRQNGREGHAPRPGEARDDRGRRLHVRTATMATPSGPVSIMASGPRQVVEAPLRAALVPLLGSLALLGAALAAATMLQLRIGLRPLRALRENLADIVAGERRHVAADQPVELQPLADELNLLIDRNAAQLDQARRHLANLAHGLKTPLAALDLQIAASGADRDGSLAAAIARIDRRIAHHLRRARAVAAGGHRAPVPLGEAVADLLAVLRRIHADGAVAATTSVDPAFRVAVDPQDLDEMVGNLLDNAWRHAAGRGAVTARVDLGFVILAIEDDGAGLAQAALEEAMMPGRRLDERGPGHGFGLPITRELAELNGGALVLGRSDALGGVLAELRLPMTARR